MENLGALLIPWGAGFLAGYLACIPVGPVNVTIIINEGARVGFRHTFFIGLGAVVMEMLYSGAAFAGFAQLFTTPLLRATMELVMRGGRAAADSATAGSTSQLVPGLATLPSGWPRLWGQTGA